jgi:hypothetical protein
MGWALLLLACAVACWLAWQPQPAGQRRAARWLVLLSGLVGAPFGLFSFMYIPRYWHPQLTWWFGPASPEDILFQFATAAIAMSLALWPFRGRLTLPRPDWRMFLKRYAAFAVMGIGCGYGILFTLQGRIDTMSACLVAIAITASLVFRCRPDLWRIVWPGLLFVPLYWLSMRCAFLLWPAFTHAWDAPEQLPRFWGAPIYELLWAAAQGGVWPPFIAWCAGLRLPGNVSA